MFNSENEDRQTEFFSDYTQMAKKPKKRNFSLGKIALSLSYEGVILLAIGLIMGLIVCYSLGVEKGKHLAQLKGGDIEEVKQEEVQKMPTKESPKPKEKKIRVKVAQALESQKTSPYIQVASFRTDKYARKELARLKDKGYQPFLTTWGKYRVVCVGGYKNKDEAREALGQLKKLYADCILHK